MPDLTKSWFGGLWLASFALLCAVWVSHPVAAQGPQQRASSDVKNSGSPVLLELFTSEGCSSCPPADELLAKLEAQQPVANVQVIALEEHVDYWNNLGWVDPFSGPEWTERQQDYAATLKNGNPYTPQLVINGHTEFAGGRANQALQAIATAAREATTQVTLTTGPADKHDQHLDISVGKLGQNVRGDSPEIWLAITEAGLHSSVSRGENAGRELQHASIVRQLRKIGTADQNKDVSFSRKVSVALESQWNRQNLRAVVFVQEKKSRQIIGAAEARIGQ
jgi:hypothetical protein